MTAPASPVTPLAGVRVLDLSRVLAGPWCGMVLGDFGADVIKIEHPERGDDTRDWGLRTSPTQTTYFNSVNRNKRSVALDLQSPQGLAVLLDLVRQSDVVIHNFKVGGAEKLGLGYEQLKAIRPDLIYCSISGYDPTGSEAKRPGYDLLVQGEAGLMAINGEAGQPPLKFGVAVVDLFTGMYAAQAVLAALFERRQTGQGRQIEMALFDSGLMITAYYGLEALLMQKDAPRYGNAHPSIVPYGVFDAADGPLVITVGNNSQFERFCRQVIERPDLADDARFKTNVLRMQHRELLLPQITQALRERPRQQLLKSLAAAGIPCGEVLGLHEALTSERAQQSGLIHQSATDPNTILTPPYRLDGERLPLRHRPPALGAHTHEVLGELLDMTAAEIDALG